MDVFVVTKEKSTSTKRTELPLDQAVALDSQRGEVTAPNLDRKDALILLRPTHTSVVLVSPGPDVPLSVNGRPVHGGLYQVDATNALIRFWECNHPWGNPSLSSSADSTPVAIVFDDSVSDVPSGSPCDICGKIIAAEGKNHCRKNICGDCVEFLGSKCPDCGRELLVSEERPELSVAEFLV